VPTLCGASRERHLAPCPSNQRFSFRPTPSCASRWKSPSSAARLECARRNSRTAGLRRGRLLYGLPRSVRSLGRASVDLTEAGYVGEDVECNRPSSSSWKAPSPRCHRRVGETSPAGVPAGRYHQYPVRVRRRVWRPREDHLGARPFHLDWFRRHSGGARGPQCWRDLPPPEDLLKYGLIPEFVGRLPVLATLEDLDEPALKHFC
jgi:hypothetical protein